MNWRAVSATLFWGLLFTSQCAAADDSHFCIAKVEDAPGFANLGRFPFLRYREEIPVAPFFVGAGDDGLWTFDGENRRQLLSNRWTGGNIVHHIMIDPGSGELLFSEDGLFRVEADGKSHSVPGQSDAFKRVRGMAYVERLGATYILTESGLFSYNKKSGTKLIEATASLTTNDSSAFADLPHLKRIFIATDREMTFVTDDGTVERIADFVPDQRRNNVVAATDFADGSGALVITHSGILAVTPDGNSFQVREIYNVGPNSSMQIKWGFVSWQQSGDIKRTPNGLLLSGKEGQFRVHPRDGMQQTGASFIANTPEMRWDFQQSQKKGFAIADTQYTVKIDDGKLLVVGGGGEPIAVKGQELLADFKIIQITSTGNRQTVLVVTNGGMFEVLDDRTPAGRSCHKQAIEVPLSQNICAVPITTERLYAPYVRGLIPGQSGRVWVSTSEASLLIEKGGRRMAAIQSQTDHYSSQEVLADIPWLDGALIRQARYRPASEVHDMGLQSQITLMITDHAGAGSPLPVPSGVQNIEFIAVVPSRKAILLSGYDGNLNKLYIAGDNGSISTIDSGAATSFSAKVLDDTGEVLIATTEPRRDKNLVLQELPRHPYFNRLWRLETSNVLTELKFPGNPSPGSESPASVGISGLAAWPSRHGILVSTDQGYFLYSNGQLNLLPVNEKVLRSIPVTSFTDLGPDSPGVALGFPGAMAINDKSPTELIKFPVGSPLVTVNAVSRDADGRGIILATSNGLYLRQEDGTVVPLTLQEHPLNEVITNVVMLPKTKQNLIVSRAGLRVLSGNGSVYRVAGALQARSPDFSFGIFAGRIIPGSLGSNQPFEILERVDDDPPCAP